MTVQTLEKHGQDAASEFPEEPKKKALIIRYLNAPGIYLFVDIRRGAGSSRCN